jgi:hypothetical protein
MRTDVSLALRAVIVSCLIVAVGACSQKPESTAESKPASGGASAAAVAAASELAASDMVVAVGTGKSSVPVEVRFNHAKRPEIGVPLEVVVSVLPTGPVERLQLVFQAQDGVRVTANSNFGPVERPTVGTDIRHVVTVTPRLEGVHTVSAVVLVETADVSLSRSFAIPLVIVPPVDVPPASEKPAESP